MSFKINNLNLQSARTQTFEIVNSFTTFNNNDICTVSRSPVGMQDPCNLVYVINNSDTSYTIDLNLYPINDITFVYSSDNTGTKVVLLGINEAISLDNLSIRVYRDNNGVWACMC